MTLEARIAGLFRLDAEGWARHANPISGWSRMASGIPLIILAVWSRVWLGWWALLPVALVALWLWLNPRMFTPPRDDSSWMSRGVFGERLWAQRDNLPRTYISPVFPNVLSAFSAAGAVAMIVGLYRLDLALTLAGGIVAFVAKTIFIGQMAKLYDRAIAAQPELAYTPPA